MVAEALLLLTYQMSTVFNSFLSNELSSNRILLESQLPVLREKGLFACQRTNKGLSHFNFANNSMFPFPNRNRYSSFSNDRSETNRSLS